MPIDVACPVCSRALYLSDDLAGRQIRCPGCQNILTVPTPHRPPPLPEPMEPPQPEQVLPAAPVDVFRERLDEPAPKPKPLTRPRPPGPPAAPESGFGTANAGIGGGLLMMIIGAIWAGVELWLGWIHFYPFVLFIVGVVAFCRGMMKKRTEE